MEVEKTSRLCNILKALRKINQKTGKFTDQRRFIEEVAKDLKIIDDYKNIWIVLLDENHDIVSTASTDSGASFLTKTGNEKVTKFISNILNNKKIVSKTESLKKETDFGKNSQTKLVAKLVNKGEIYGILGIKTVKDPNSEEIGILEEIANELAYSLHKLRVEQLRKEKEEELTEREERLELALWSTGDGLWDWNLEDEEAYYSDQWIEMLGFDIDEIDRDIEMWRDLIHPDHKKGVEKSIERHLEGKSPHYEAEYKIRKKSGEYIWVRDRGKVVDRDRDGNALRMVGTIQDITERKEAEEREEFLHQLLRHDLRNKIQISEGYLELLEDSDLSDEEESYIKKAKKANKDGIELIEKVRALKKIGKEKTKDMNVDLVIENAINENKNLAEERGFEIKHERDNMKVKGGPLLEELFSNLIKNSLQHSKGNTIKISSCSGKKKNCVISVEDNGRGIPDNQKNKIFFFFFKDGEEAGSGLGVHLVKKIAESYGGSVEIKDSELEGARFDVYLPKSED